MAIYLPSHWVYFFKLLKLLRFPHPTNKHKKKSYQLSVTRFGLAPNEFNQFNTFFRSCQENFLKKSFLQPATIIAASPIVFRFDHSTMNRRRSGNDIGRPAYVLVYFESWKSLAWANPSERLHWPIPFLHRADAFPRETGVPRLGRAGYVIHPTSGLMKSWRGVCPGHWRREGKTGGSENSREETGKYWQSP